jgi:hypothetical protein
MSTPTTLPATNRISRIDHIQIGDTIVRRDPSHIREAKDRMIIVGVVIGRTRNSRGRDVILLDRQHAMWTGNGRSGLCDRLTQQAFNSCSLRRLVRDGE